MKKKKIQWPIVVRTRRLEIRPYQLKDYQIWRKAFTQRKEKQHKYDRGPLTLKHCSKAFYRKLYLRHERYAKKDICYPFGLYDRKTGEHVGFIDISTICRDWYQWASLGYVIHNTHQRKGYGKEAARAGIQIAFKKLGYKRVEASIYPDNKRSIALAKSVGMKREGLRKEYIFDNGLWEDHVIYAILNPRQKRRSYPLL
jgi:RimJ/RimL family protein N-acetyltransferase